jgi:hypothetical protein
MDHRLYMQGMVSDTNVKRKERKNRPDYDLKFV